MPASHRSTFSERAILQAMDEGIPLRPAVMEGRPNTSLLGNSCPFGTKICYFEGSEGSEAPECLNR